MLPILLMLCERAQPVVRLLNAEEQATASQAWQLCEQYALHETATDDDRKALARCVEYLARRSAAGIPLATLGRAVLAHYSGSKREYEATLADAEVKLTIAGL